MRLMAILGISACLLCGLLLFLLSGTTDEKKPAGPGGPGASSRVSSGPSDVGTEASPAIKPRLLDTTEKEATASESGWEIRVVRLADEAPVDGAEVYRVPRHRLPRHRLLEASSPFDADLIAISRTFGERFASGSGGRAHLPELEPGDTLVAIHGESSGTRPILTSAVLEQSRSLQVALAPDAHVDVLVLNAQEQPVPNIPLRLARSPSMPLQRGVSDASGRSRLPIPGYLFTHLIDHPLAVALDVIQFEVPAVRFSLEAIPQEAITFTVPPLARLVATISDPSGSPYQGEASIKATSFSVAATLQRTPTAPTVCSRTLRDGKARFLVGLVHQVNLTAVFSPTSPWKAPRESCIGPFTAGEAYKVELRIEEKRPMLIGRVLDTRGNPVSKRRLQSTYRIHDDMRFDDLDTGSFETDEEGRFRIILNDRFGAGHLHELIITPEKPEGSMPLRASIPFDHEPRPGENDLGTARFEPRPLLLSGTLVDPEGRPVAGARISAAALLPASDAAGQPWSRSVEASTSSDSQGRFRLLEAWHEAEAAVHLVASGFPAQSFRVVVGTENRRFTLARGGQLAGTFRMRRGQTLHGIFCELRRANGPMQSRCQLPMDGKLTLSAIPPGSYRLTLRSQPLFRTLLDLADLEVREGETTALGALEVDHPAAHLELKVLDREGKKVEFAALHVVAARERRVLEQAREPGRMSASYPLATQELIVTAPGFRDQPIGCPRGALSVTLAPALRVVLAPNGLDSEFHYVISSITQKRDEPTGSSFYNRDRIERLPDGWGFDVGAPGRYVIEMMVGQGDRWRGPIKLEIDVVDLPGVQRISVDVDPAAHEEALRALRSK